MKAALHGIAKLPIETRLQRNSSTSTVLPIRRPSSSKIRTTPPQSTITQGKQRELPEQRSLESQPRLKQVSLTKETSVGTHGESAVSSSSDSDVAAPRVTQYRTRTYSRQSQNNPTRKPMEPASTRMENPADSPPFLPFSNADLVTQRQHQRSDPMATLQNTSHPQFKSKSSVAATRATDANDKRQQSSSRPDTSHSSSSSAQSTQPPVGKPLKSQRQAPLSSLSPRQRRQLRGTTSGSDGTSGIGSSFSDLDDDFSGTQSALEEALAGEMERGGVASRMSTISQALRSKHL